MIFTENFLTFALYHPILIYTISAIVALGAIWIILDKICNYLEK